MVERPLKLLIGMPAPSSWGGPIYSEPPLVHELRRLGMNVVEETYVYGEGAEKISITERERRVIEAAARIAKRCRKGNFDVVTLNTSIDEKCVLRDLYTMFRLPKGVPVLLKMHGSIAAFLKTRNPFWVLMKRSVFGRAAKIAVLSSEERQNFIDAGCPADKLIFFKYPFRPHTFERSANFRAEHGVGDDVPLLLFSARFIPAKGLLTVIEACSILRSEGRDFQLFCLGDGPVRAVAETRVRELGLEEIVRFTGYIQEDETDEFHANADIFVFPTYHDEGFPLVLIKSLAAGTPIITTRVRAAMDHLTEPENCLWVEPRSPAELAGRIRELIDSSALRGRMSENNKRLAEAFRPEAVAAEFIDIYEDLAKKRSAA